MKRADFEVAIAAGLSVAFPLYKIFTMRESDGSPNPLAFGEAGILLLVILCYLAAPLPLHLLSRYRVARLTWLWAPVLGSALVAVADYCFRLIYVDTSVVRAAKEWLVLSVWTLPFAAAIYYSGAVVRLIRRWHDGSGANLSILRR